MPKRKKQVYSPQSWKRRSVKSRKPAGKRKAKMPSYRGRRDRRSWRSKLIRTLLLLFVVGFIVGLAVLVGAFAYIGKDIPNPGQILEREVPVSTKIYDRTGEELLYEVHGDQQRTLVALEELPAYVAQASLMAEDRNFYSHPGFDLKGILRAGLGVATGTNRGGGSTITQQFVKNAILTNERTYTRKIKELILSYQLEQRFDKDQILEFYLNEIPYGSTAYGVEAAANIYFNKSAKDLTLAEAATLASMPQVPKYYSPFSSSYDEDRLLARRNWVLDGMEEGDHASKEEVEAAQDVPLEFAERKGNIKAPHFVFWVKDQLEEEYGARIVDQGGLRIVTTLDMSKQEKAEKAVAEFADQNEERWNASNAALVAMDPKTGEVVAMVGSRDYFDDEIDGQVNVALAKRQPGSSIKPIVYAAAWDKGYTPETTLYDVSTGFVSSIGTAEEYRPVNYDGEVLGPVSMRKALQGSLNIPAVKALYLAGIENAISFAENLGYSTFKDRSRFGLSFVLGGGEVILLEHVRAFAAFAREGEQPETVSILRVEDSEGNVLQEFEKPKKKKVIKPEVARTVNNVLSDNEARTYVFGASSKLQMGDRPVAAKTGTTSDNKDAWLLGYTPSLVAGVWAGNSDATPMKDGAGGSSVAGPIWNSFMHRVLDGTPTETFRAPEPDDDDLPPILMGQAVGEVTVLIDRFTGRPANDFTPEDQVEEKTFKKHHSILHYVDKDNPRPAARAAGPADPSRDPEHEGWEQGVREWVAEQEISEDALPGNGPDVSPENRPTVYFVKPQADAVIADRMVSFDVTAAAPLGLERVDYFLGSARIASVRQAPYDLEGFALPNRFENGFYLLRAVAYDGVGNYSSAEKDINLNAPSLPLSLNWKSPRGGASFYSSSLPLTLTAGISDPSNVSEVRFSRLFDDESEAVSSWELFYTSFEIRNQEASAVLGASTAPGRYDVRFEVVFSDGSAQTSGILSINILP